MPVHVEILDLGINNLASLNRGLEAAGAQNLRVIASSDDSRGAKLMVLPGVGAFGAAVEELHTRGLYDLIQAHVQSGGYLFGVCLGMQLLSTDSEESPNVEGLNLINGKVRRLKANSGARVPNMGWGSSLSAGDAPDFPVLSKLLDYYFVHSYSVVPDDVADTLAISEFGEQVFVSAVKRDNVLGVQFHPEKSSHPGVQLLREVLTWANG